jgi:hypothetical protein
MAGTRGRGVRPSSPRSSPDAGRLVDDPGHGEVHAHRLFARVDHQRVVVAAHHRRQHGESDCEVGRDSLARGVVHRDRVSTPQLPANGTYRVRPRAVPIVRERQRGPEQRTRVFANSLLTW